MRRITLIIYFLFTCVYLFSQDKEGSLFYSFVEKTDTEYKVNVDIFEVGKIKYIEIELVNEDKNQLASEIAELIFKEGKYYLNFKNEEKQIYHENINMTLKNEYNDIKYPQINVKLLDRLFQIIDYSQKVFY